MRSLKFFICAAVLFTAFSCNDKIPVPADDSDKVPVVGKDSTTFSCQNISWIGVSDEYYNEFAFRTDAIGRELSDNTSVVFLDMAAMSANIGKLGKLYGKGSVVVVLNPDMEAVAKYMERNGWCHMYPTAGDIALYAFSNKGAYAIHKAEKAKAFEGTTEPESGAEAVYEIDVDNKAVAPDPYSGYDFDELGYYLGPFIKWINEVTSDKSNGDLDGYAIFTEQKNYNLELYVHHVALSSKDYIKGPYSVSVNYKYKPMYVFADQSYNPGDYYLFDVSYITETGKIFQGDDFTHKHGGITVHITGAFLRELNVVTYIDGDGSNPKFIAGFEPIPESDINTVNYSKTHSWNIGGGVTGGFSKKDGAQGEVSFNWGVTNSNTVSYSVSDLGVRNNTYSDYNGHGAAPAWTFLGQNLPGPKGDKGFNGNTPQIARSTGTFHTSWVWYSGSHKESDINPLGDIVTIIKPVLGGAHNGLCVDGEKNTWNIDQAEFRTKMVVPFRIPFGTVSIDNTFKEGEIISDVVVTDTATGKEVYNSFGDFSSSKPCVFSIPEGKYDISMNVTDNNRQTARYKLINPIQLQRRKSESDIYNIDSYVRFQPE